MIFVTVGTQLPFDRLIRCVDDWAATHPGVGFFAQIGPSLYRPCHMQWARSIDSQECRRRTAEADVIVAHAGMGSIITALECGKPIIIMPRRADLGEHRNDHQMATARHLAAQRRVSIAYDEMELFDELDDLENLRAGAVIPPSAQPQLLAALAAFVDHGVGPIPEVPLMQPSYVDVTAPRMRAGLLRREVETAP
jgi:UDP-N-acetylglucosamine transferase subunit ALG13